MMNATEPRRSRMVWSALALCLAATACANAPATSTEAMRVEANMATVRRTLEEVWNNRNLAVIADAYAADHVGYTNGVRDSLSGPAGVEAGTRGIQTMYPDARLVIDDMFATVDRVVTQWTWTAMDVPTGMPMKILAHRSLV